MVATHEGLKCHLPSFQARGLVASHETLQPPGPAHLSHDILSTRKHKKVMLYCVSQLQWNAAIERDDWETPTVVQREGLRLTGHSSHRRG